MSNLEYGEKVYNIKELNEQAQEEGIEDVNSNSIKTIINFWTIKGWVKRQILSSLQRTYGDFLQFSNRNSKRKTFKKI